MGLRLLTGLIGIPILLLFILMGGAVLEFGIGILMILVTKEFGRMMNRHDHQIALPALFIGELIFLIAIWFGSPDWASMGIAATFLLVLIHAIIHYPKIGITDIAVNLFTLIYVGWTLAHIMLISNLDQGKILLIYLFVCIWASDSGAYFVGRFMGKHKLAPVLSPKKTIEGSIGGIVATILTGVVFNGLFPVFSWGQVLILSTLVSLVGQLGDLIESMFKRLVGVKDSGNILPGHGGMLDRFDSVMIAAPIIYLLLIF